MHRLKVLTFGPNSFITTLVELKPYLKFNLSETTSILNKEAIMIHDILFFHEEVLNNNKNKDIINNANIIKILAYDSLKTNHTFDAALKLPTSVNEINNIVEKSAIKKKFTQNSSVQIKDYFLDKNEKKLFKNNEFIILTEKEVQLLDLFLNNASILKNEILSKVWHYAADADTHTVETHIYRLRKKIKDKFSDEKFILNNKDGYYI